MMQGWVRRRLPKVLPATWIQEKAPYEGQACFFNIRNGMSVIVSGDRFGDGKRWLHVSCVANGRLPTWDELMEVKDLFVGREQHAVQVIPPRSQHVNIHPHCLHLFSCADGHPLPDFTGGTGSL